MTKRSYSAHPEKVLAALQSSSYTVDIEAGIVISNRTTRPVYLFYHRISGVDGNHAFLRVSYQGIAYSISLARAIWMYSRGCIVPTFCDVHHLDLNSANNNWRNLICIYHLDHTLVHQILNGHTISSNSDNEWGL